MQHVDPSNMVPASRCHKVEAPARIRLSSTASAGAVAAAIAADAQVADDKTSAILQEALAPHKEALTKADVRRVTFLSPNSAGG